MSFIRALNKATELLKNHFKYDRFSTQEEAQEIADMFSELTGKDWQINLAGSDGYYIWENE